MLLDHIDAGYEWDGWNLYEQSMGRIRQQPLPMQITPWAYVLDPEYLFAFSVLPHYHLERIVRFDSPFGPRVNTFFILKRDL